MVPDRRRDGLEVEPVEVLDEDDRVRHPRVRGADLEPVDHLEVLPVAEGRDALPVEGGLGHADRRLEVAIVVVPCLDRDRARARLHDERLARVPVVDRELRQAPGAVAAHPRLGTVRLEEAHPQGALVRGEEQDAVASDPETPVAVDPRELRLHRLGDDGPRVLVDQHEVVAVAVEFLERDLHEEEGMGRPFM